MRDPRDDGNILYFECVNVNILVVILYCSFARCYHWSMGVKVHGISLHHFLELHENLQS